MYIFSQQNSRRSHRRRIYSSRITLNSSTHVSNLNGRAWLKVKENEKQRCLTLLSDFNCSLFNTCGGRTDVANPEFESVMFLYLLMSMAPKPFEFNLELTDLLFAVACDCTPPKVDLQLKHSIPESDILYTTNRSFILRTTVANNCSISNVTQYQWMFSRVDSETNYFSPFITYGVTDRSQMKLVPRIMGPGDLYVYLEVSILGLSWAFAHDYGFVRIRHPDLVAKIVAPAIVSKQGTAVKLDGSRSYDPEFTWPQYTRLEFSWRCQRQCRVNPSDNLPVDRASVEPCFGIANSTDYVLSNQRAFTIDVVFLKSSCTYFFRLTVAKDSRITHADHALEVTPGVAFSIRYVCLCFAPQAPSSKQK